MSPKIRKLFDYIYYNNANYFLHDVSNYISGNPLQLLVNRSSHHSSGVELNNKTIIDEYRSRKAQEIYLATP